jgi:SHS2 domain-containing protein
MTGKDTAKREKVNYEFLEHTADVKFTSHGRTFEEALENACRATTSVMTDISKIENNKIIDVIIKSKSKESLVYDLLEKLIYLADTEGFLLGEVKINIKRQNDEFVLSANLRGDNAESYDVHTQIKAATYNDMQIIEEDNYYTITAVLDI